MKYIGYIQAEKNYTVIFFVNKKRIFTFVSFIHSGFNERTKPSLLSFSVDAEFLFFYASLRHCSSS